MELDSVRTRAMSAATRPRVLAAGKKGTFMRSRLAVVMVLALGVTLSGTGAALAVSGMSEGGSAGTAQYPTNERCKEGQTVGPHGEPCKPYTCAEGAHVGP